MSNLSKSQYKMLCRIKKEKTTSTNSLSKEEVEICSYLLTHGCIVPRCSPALNSSGRLINIKLLPEHLKITQEGEAHIYSFRSTFYKWWIPVVVSIFSLLISIASLAIPLITTIPTK